MKFSEILLGSLLLSPHIYTVCNLLSRFTNLDYFMLASFFSLIALFLSNYSFTILLFLMLIPSLVSFLMFFLGSPLPLIGSAAGYLLAFPIFILLSSYRQNIEDLVLTYFFTLTFNLWVLASSDKASLTSQDFFVNLIIRVPGKLFSGEQYTLSQTVNTIFTFLTAASCISLFLIICRRCNPDFPREVRDLTPLIISSIIVLLLAFMTRVWTYNNIFSSLSVLLIILGLSIILRIVK
ncbi:MAG: hypothetical protein QXF28_07465 [Nitrososphaerota archaeon]